MLARLWWKEWRTLAPIAAVLAGSAVVMQWFLLRYGGAEIREGILVSLGFGWAMLYAFVAGSSSFAGERENRTMGLLDALPVDRRTLWLGKATFALASSVVLAAALMLLGVAGSDRLGPSRQAQVVGPVFGALVLAWGVALGLFWSAWCRSAITAGILAVLATGLVPGGIERSMPLETTIRNVGSTAYGPGPISAAAVLAHLALLAVVLGASWWVVVREIAPRSPRRWSFAFAKRPIRLRPAILDRGPRLRILPSAAFGRVMWQTFREGRSTWLGTVGLALLLPASQVFAEGPTNDTGAMEYGLVLLALVIQGASVFGLENAAGTRQFLDNVAVPPRTVWAAKVVAWGLGLVAFAAILLGASIVASEVAGKGQFLLRGTRDDTEAYLLLAGAGNAFAVGMVAGMALTRRITAVLVAALAAFAVALPQFGAVGSRLAPAWGLAIVPTALVGATFLWAGDWLAVRPGWRRWARLAALVGVPYAATGLLYVGGRAWGVPDIGPQFDAAAGRGPSELAGEYRRIKQALAPGDAAISPALTGRNGDVYFAPGGDRPVGPATREILAAHAADLAEVRRLSARPDAAWFGPARSILDRSRPEEWSQTLISLLWHLNQEAEDRRQRGDMAGAWDDILAQVRLADQFARGVPSVGDYGFALVKSAWAAQALAWAADPRTPLAAIRAAKDSLAAAGEPPGIAEAVRAGARRVELDLSRPADDWVDYLNPPGNRSGLTPLERIGASWLVAPIWERERTRRVLRLAAAAALRDAGRPRPQRKGLLEEAELWGGKYALQTPLAQMLLREAIGADDDRDRELANRRALVVFFALRAWQLTHGGVAPASLDKLIPAELAAIPVDPYSLNGSPLGYGPIDSPPLPRDASQAAPETPGPQPLVRFALCSVGPDGGTHVFWPDGSNRGFRMGALANELWVPMADDLTYPLPPCPAGAEPPAAPRPDPGPPPGAVPTDGPGGLAPPAAPPGR